MLHFLGTQPGEYKDLSGVTTGIYSNGTIRFDHVKKSDEGSYLCEARNDVGSGLSKVVFLKVNGKVKVLSLLQCLYACLLCTQIALLVRTSFLESFQLGGA